MTTSRVLGLDGCREGWVGVFYDGTTVSASVRPRIEDFRDEGVELVGVDMPIGLPSTGRRRCDEAGKALLGRRASTLFHVPPRVVLEATTFDEANRRHRELLGLGLTRQSWNLRDKILEVDAWMERAPFPSFEVHPEISFTKLTGAPLPTKKSFAGVMARRRALVEAGLDVESLVNDVGTTGVDDVLDATVVAWSAWELLQDQAWRLPKDPDFDDHGLAMAIFA